TGVHPTGAFGDVRPGPGDRYAETFADLRGLLGRTPYCGMHVHVGMPDAEMAIRACNGMRKWVPLLIALSANSPFWHGLDSGLASARVALARSVPRVGVPRAFRDYEDFAGVLESLFAAGDF